MRVLPKAIYLTSYRFLAELNSFLSQGEFSCYHGSICCFSSLQILVFIFVPLVVLLDLPASLLLCYNLHTVEAECQISSQVTVAVELI